MLVSSSSLQIRLSQHRGTPSHLPTLLLLFSLSSLTALLICPSHCPPFLSFLIVLPLCLLMNTASVRCDEFSNLCLNTCYHRDSPPSWIQTKYFGRKHVRGPMGLSLTLRVTIEEGCGLWGRGLLRVLKQCRSNLQC